MLKVIKRPLAEADLINIWLYTFETWNEQQADDYLKGMEATIQSIAENPKIGMKIDHIREGYRQYKHQHHLILYMCIPAAIDIIRILHERMDVEPHAATLT